MPNGARSPFGELVFRYRRRLGMSRRELADRAYRLAASGRIEATVSERTVARIERIGPPDAWHLPHMLTVSALATLLELRPGSAEHEAFTMAALADPAGDREPAPGAPPALDLDRAHFDVPEFYPAGRESQLRRLADAIDVAVAGRAGAIFVNAGAGVGKTSLIAAACHAALARHEGTAVLWAASHNRQGPPLPWEPFRTMLGLMTGDLEVASERELLTPANAAEIGRRVPTAARALTAESAGLVGWLLPTGTLANTRLTQALDAETRRQLEVTIRNADAARPAEPPDEALFRALMRYASEGPVLLVLEDLHWADTGTASALSHLLARLADRHGPVLVIGSYRPGELVHADGTDRPLAHVLRQVPRWYPDALIDLSRAVGGEEGRAFVEAIVARLKPPEAAPVVDALFARTAGMPLAVINMLRLLEPNPLTPEAILAVSLPEEIGTVYAEQLHRLDLEVRTLLIAASVQGDMFWAEPVMRMLGIDRDRFIELIDSRLVRQFRMLRPRGTTSIGGQTLHRYEFAHALLRDYLVSSLTELERERWHERTADALIALLGERDHDATDRIAVHLEQARKPDRAAVAWLHAGTHALARREFDRAVPTFSRVLALDLRASDPSTYILAMVGLGNCHRGMSRSSEARQTLEEALALATRAHLPVAQGYALEALAMVDLDAGEMQAGVERSIMALELWTDAGHDEAGRAMANLSYLLYGLGRYEEAIDFARRGREVADRIDEPRMWLDAEIALANAWMDLGLYTEAMGSYRRACQVCQDLGDVHREHICRVNLVLAGIETGDWDATEQAARHLLRASPEPAMHLVGYLQHHLGMVAEARADPEAAHAHYETSREIRERAGHEAVLIDSLAGLLRVAIVREDLDRIRSLRDDIVSRVEERGLDGIEHVGRMYLTLIDASDALGDAVAGERYLREGIAFLGERASRLSDATYRASWLDNPPAHRRLAAMAATRVPALSAPVSGDISRHARHSTGGRGGTGAGPA